MPPRARVLRRPGPHAAAATGRSEVRSWSRTAGIWRMSDKMSIGPRSVSCRNPGIFRRRHPIMSNRVKAAVMARNPEKAALALHRFGFGPRAGTIAAIASDPQAALKAELDRPNAGQIDGPRLPSSDSAFRSVFEFNAARNARAKLARLAAAAAPAMQPVMAATDDASPDNAAETPLPQQIFLAEAAARFDAARNAEIGFVERWVWFWSNHFCVSADTSVMAGGYEREAIRPHVLGPFVELLLAA